MTLGHLKFAIVCAYYVSPSLVVTSHYGIHIAKDAKVKKANRLVLSSILVPFQDRLAGLDLGFGLLLSRMLLCQFSPFASRNGSVISNIRRFGRFADDIFRLGRKLDGPLHPLEANSLPPLSFLARHAPLDLGSALILVLLVFEAAQSIQIVHIQFVLFLLEPINVGP